MRFYVCILLPLLGAVAPEPVRTRPVGLDEGMLPYRFEWGERRFEDVLLLRDGAKHLGKILEWADQVLVYRADGGATCFDAKDVASFEFRRGRRQLERPGLADLTVAYVERLPRDPSWQGSVERRDGLLQPTHPATGVSWKPKTGQAVTFRIHVLNAGAVPAPEGNCRILVDGVEIKSAVLSALAPDSESVIEASWPWAEAGRTLRVELTTKGDVPEAQKWNNVFEEPIQALGVAIVVAADRLDAFGKVPNLVDSFCFADWVQHQLHCFNALLRTSAYSTAPRGSLERVRCDRIIVEENPALGANSSWPASLRQGGRADGLAEYAAILAYPRMGDNEVARFSSLKVDWPQLQRLGAQLGLVDLRKTDTTIEQCLVLDAREQFVDRQHLFPWRDTLMFTAGPFPLSEPDVGYLNAALGQPRGFRGEYLYQLPEKLTLRVLSNAGMPLEGVQVEAYQLHGDGPYAGTICGYGRDPLFAAFTDTTGRVQILNQETPAYRTPNGFELRPNPFGRILPDGSNGLLMFRLKRDANEEYYFQRLFDLHVAFLKGEKSEYVREVKTRFASPGAPKTARWFPIAMEDRSEPHPPLSLTWKWPDGSRPGNTEEFRIYKRTSFGGDDIKPWTLSSIVRKSGQRWNLMAEGTYFDEFRDDGPYSLDTFYGLSTVDKQGRESDLVHASALVWKKDALKLAIDAFEAFITVDGPGPVQMLHHDGERGTQPFGIRATAVPGYRPSCCGIAVTPEHRLVVTDPRNHVLAFYDLKGNLEELTPARDWWPGYASTKPGEFNQPLDVAAGDGGRLYVADYANHRVQILDGRGGFLGLLDEAFAFEGPHALGYGNGHLCVTDRAGTRMRVYDCRGERPQFVRQLPALIGADRGLVNRGGKVFLTGKASESADPSILTFVSAGESATFDSSADEVEGGKVYRPRGMYLNQGWEGGAHCFLVNDFPFDVRAVQIEPNDPGKGVPVK